MDYNLSHYLVAPHHAMLQAEAHDTRRARRIQERPSLINRIVGQLRGERRNPAPSRPLAAGR